jgi:branched-chain amino acid transport system substrate-binding protein
VGLEAGIGVAAQEGYKIKYVLGDTTSTPSGALAAPQRLVDQDHVSAVIAPGVFTYGAAAYLASKNIPVIGASLDSSEWNQYPNMFDYYGYADYSLATTTTDLTLKLLGVTDFGAVGYGDIPSSTAVVKGAVAAAPTVGLKVGYSNANFPISSSNVGPEVIALKNAGVDGVTFVMGQQQAFAIQQGLNQNGVHPKAVLDWAGDGTDLSQYGPAAEQLAQGSYIALLYEPIEMHTAATEKFVKALAQARSTVEPDLAEYLEYIGVDLFVRPEIGRPQSNPDVVHPGPAQGHPIPSGRAI